MNAALFNSLTNVRSRLVGWLVHDAYPLWSNNAVDPAGGFAEALDANGRAHSSPRRARVPPRQIFAFSHAPAFGWQGASVAIIERGIRHFTKHYRRGDGLYRTLIAADGTPLDNRAILYDQAFALLGFAAAAAALDAREHFEERALDLRRAITAAFQTADGAFRAHEGAALQLEANPHMHLLEACLAWRHIGADAAWGEWVDNLAGIAVRFIRPASGALGEYATPAGAPTPGIAGKSVEPGHQFEWAWLLLRCDPGSASLLSTALRLIAVGETFGVRNGIAVNALADDLAISDPKARFWPQTERLKAAVLAADITGDEQYWSMALSAATSFFPYLATRIAGSWYDEQLPTKEMSESAAPASTFYHVVAAVQALDQALQRAT